MIEYRTVSKSGDYEYEIKKSRFICSVAHVETEEEVEAFLEDVHSRYKGARHYPYAYQLGENNERQQARDDGEPNGTSGLMILEVLQQMDLKNIVCVVTRYFGGIKLGKGGLIRAYRHAAREGIKAQGVVLRTLQLPLSFTVPYALTGSTEYWLESVPYLKGETEYMEEVTYHLFVPEAEIASVQEELINLTSDQIQFDVGEVLYVDVPTETHIDGEEEKE